MKYSHQFDAYNLPFGAKLKSRCVQSSSWSFCSVAVKNIGFIYFTSKPGEGTTFYIEFPVEKAFS